MRCARRMKGDCRPLSALDKMTARPSRQSGTAHKHVRRQHKQTNSAPVRKNAICWRSPPLSRKQVARRSHRGRRRSANSNRSSQGAQSLMKRQRPAHLGCANCTTTIGNQHSRDRDQPRTPDGISCTGWSGSRGFVQRRQRACMTGVRVRRTSTAAPGNGRVELYLGFWGGVVAGAGNADGFTGSTGRESPARVCLVRF